MIQQYPKRFDKQITRDNWIILTETTHEKYFMIVYIRLINNSIFSLIGEFPEDIEDNNVYVKLYAFRDPYEYVLYEKEISPHDYWVNNTFDQTKILEEYSKVMDIWLGKTEEQLWSLIMEADL